MNSKLWINKALSACLTVALIATYSLVALANSEKIAGELLVSGKTVNGQNPFVKVNGEEAQSGRSIFTGSTVATSENAGAIVNLGKIGKIELAPNTIMSLSFDEKGVSGDLTAGQVTVLNSADTVAVKTLGGKTAELKAGESANATGTKAQNDDDNDDHHGALLLALILGGAAVAIIIAARSDNNRIALGGGTTVVSTTR